MYQNVLHQQMSTEAQKEILCPAHIYLGKNMYQNVPHQQMSTEAQKEIICPVHIYLGKKGIEDHNKSKTYN